MKLLVALMVVLTLVTFDTSRRVRAQAVDCGDPRDIPIHHLLCQYRDLNAKVDRLDGVVTDQARRIKALEAVSGTAGVSTADVETIAWQKAGDRIAFWQGESSAYRDRFLFDTIYARWIVHACRNGVPIRVRCP